MRSRQFVLNDDDSQDVQTANQTFYSSTDCDPWVSILALLLSGLVAYFS